MHLRFSLDATRLSRGRERGCFFQLTPSHADSLYALHRLLFVTVPKYRVEKPSRLRMPEVGYSSLGTTACR